MKKTLTLALVAITMFGGAAGASWKWRQMKLAAVAPKTPADAASDAGKNSSHDDAEASTLKTKRTADSTEPPPAERNPSSSHAPPVRAAVQPTYAPGIEETVQLASSLRDRIASVRERETQLVARQKQLELIVEDIRSEREVIDELRKQLDELLKSGEERMAEVDRRRTELEIQQQSIDGKVTEMAGQEKDNIKKMGSVYDNMAPESAAKIIQQMADTGTMDTAVKLLAVMKERQAAKVLSEIPDPTLAAQLSERLKDVKRPAATKK